MKNTIKVLKFSFVFTLLLASFLACDKDFSVIESDVLGDENANFFTDSTSLKIAAYTKKLDSVQINNLSSNLIGFYNDPAFGTTTASIVAQLVPTTYSPDFGTNPVVDSVVLTIPYFNRTTGTKDGITEYTILDSLYGEKSNKEVKPFKLSIYQNNYFIRDFDPNANTNQRQNYFSKANGTILTGTAIIDFDAQKGAEIFSSTITPSGAPTRTDIGTGATLVTTRSVPALRQKLDNTFWQTTIIDKEGDAVLSKFTDFSNYFRGLYFKAEPDNGDGSMILLNLASTNANITIYYSKDAVTAGEKTQASYVLRFTGTILNAFTNNYNVVSLQNGNKITGDEKLYLKGTEGAMAVVDMFSGTNGLKDFLDTYRIPLGNGQYKKDDNDTYVLKRLINDAQLIVYEDENIETWGNADLHKYDRIYAYDVKNNRPLDDYLTDPTIGNTASPYNSVFFHLGQRKTTSNVSSYKIHLTEHLNNILLRDSTNTKIGLTLSSNVNITNNAFILDSEDDVTAIPATSIITPRGTVLYGTKTSVPATKRMKLKIFYSETK